MTHPAVLLKKPINKSVKHNLILLQIQQLYVSSISTMPSSRCTNYRSV